MRWLALLLIALAGCAAWTDTRGFPAEQIRVEYVDDPAVVCFNNKPNGIVNGCHLISGTDGQVYTIYVRKSLSRPERACTIRHEVAHAMKYAHARANGDCGPDGVFEERR
jgi:hypothetical protein